MIKRFFESIIDENMRENKRKTKNTSKLPKIYGRNKHLIELYLIVFVQNDNKNENNRKKKKFDEK